MLRFLIMFPAFVFCIIEFCKFLADLYNTVCSIKSWLTSQADLAMAWESNTLDYEGNLNHRFQEEKWNIQNIRIF